MAPDLLTRDPIDLSRAASVRITGARPGDAARVRRILLRCERAVSRALPDSEINALNAAAPATTPTSTLLFDVISEALGWACVTDGAFDPTYATPPRAQGSALAGRDTPPPAARWRAVTLDHERETVTLPAGVALDLDAVGTGCAVDRAAAALGPRADALIDFGGVLYAAGDGPHGEGWYIGVPRPDGREGHAAVLNINDRGIATAPAAATAQDALASVTVVAPTATMAAVLAAVASRLAPRQAVRFVERFGGASALALTPGGGVLRTECAADYLA